MKGPWKLTYKRDGCSILYGTFRLRDIEKCDNPGNREYARNWYPIPQPAAREALMKNSCLADLRQQEAYAKRQEEKS